MFSNPERVMLFQRTWRECAERGECDTLGGAESLRVYRAWIQADCPAVLEFIQHNANAVPAWPIDGAAAALAAALPSDEAALRDRLTDLRESTGEPTDMNLFWHVFIQRLFEERLHIGSLLRWLEAFEARMEEENVSKERLKAMHPYFDKAGDFCRGLVEELMHLQRSRRRPLQKPAATNHGQEE